MNETLTDKVTYSEIKFGACRKTTEIRKSWRVFLLVSM